MFFDFFKNFFAGITKMVSKAATAKRIGCFMQKVRVSPKTIAAFSKSMVNSSANAAEYASDLAETLSKQKSNTGRQ